MVVVRGNGAGFKGFDPVDSFLLYFLAKEIQIICLIFVSKILIEGVLF